MTKTGKGEKRRDKSTERRIKPKKNSTSRRSQVPDNVINVTVLKQSGNRSELSRGTGHSQFHTRKS